MMKHTLIAATLLAAAAPLYAQQPAPNAPPPSPSAVAAAASHEALTGVPAAPGAGKSTSAVEILKENLPENDLHLPARHEPPPIPTGEPIVSVRGDAIAREEFDHRMRVAALSRTLEIEMMESKIAKEKSERRKAERDDAVSAREVSFPPLVPSVAHAGGIVGATGIPAVPPPPPPPSAPPKVVGIVGDRVFLKHDDETTTHVAGDVVDGYRIESVTDGTVRLRSTSNKAQELTARIP